LEYQGTVKLVLKVLTECFILAKGEKIMNRKSTVFSMMIIGTMVKGGDEQTELVRVR